jgi:protein-disulfide isomerase
MPKQTDVPKLSTPVSNERDHTQGRPDAPITLVEYGDYECPYCGEAYPIVKALMVKFEDQARLVFRNFPLAQVHPHAERAAEAAEAAAAQNKFWEMHDLLYEQQTALEDEDLLSYAKEVGLDTDRFSTELSKGTYTARVREDFLSGVRSGVNGTPTFFINGQRHNGPWDLQSLTDAFNAILKPRAEVKVHKQPRPEKQKRR